jgi:folate-dependent phosphoribosylglycinamide formyltransferase PurN
MAAIKDGTLRAEIAITISDQADSNFLRIAREAGLPALFVDGGSNLANSVMRHRRKSSSISNGRAWMLSCSLDSCAFSRSP